jgi:hypothetical protein
MKNNLAFLFLLIQVVCISSCSHSHDPAAYIQYSDDVSHNLSREKLIGPLKYTCKYESADYTIIKQLGLKSLLVDDVNKLRNSKLHYFQFDLKIQLIKEGNTSLFKSISKNIQQYTELNSYFEHANSDFKILLDDKVVDETTYFFVPNQGFARYEELILGTDKITDSMLKKAEKIQLLYDDKIFQHGPIYFTFYSKDILAIPTLKL